MIEINSYFKALNSEVYTSGENWNMTQIGSLIDFHTEDRFPELKFAEMAIFNIPEYEGSKNNSASQDCKIRAAFYELHKEKFPRIVDLGTFNINIRFKYYLTY
jgi:hypothetical protein